MSELNDQIQQWRQNLEQSGSLSRSDIDELESHLRDEIERLTSAGLSAEEALLVAACRLGCPQELAGEFAKVNGPRVAARNVTLMAIGALAYVLVGHLTGVVSQAFVFLAALAGLRGYAPAVAGLVGKLTVLVAVLFVLLQVACARGWAGPRLSRLAESLHGRRALLAGLGLVSVMLLAVILNIASKLVTIGSVRVLGVQDFAKATVVSGCAAVLSPVLLAMIVIVLLVHLRPRSMPET